VQRFRLPDPSLWRRLWTKMAVSFRGCNCRRGPDYVTDGLHRGRRNTSRDGWMSRDYTRYNVVQTYLFSFHKCLANKTLVRIAVRVVTIPSLLCFKMMSSCRRICTNDVNL
jgi:hypothetical protein